MDASPLLARIAALLDKHGLESVLIGNAAAALQGAPVTTVDFDFMFRRTPANMRKLKAIARDLEAVLFKQFFPPSGTIRLMRDRDGLQMNFVNVIDGGPSFEGLRGRAKRVNLAGVHLLVADRSDIVRSKKATGRAPKRRATRKEKLAALKLESELALRDQIRRLLALPPEKRTNFLRKRIGPGASCL
jgi:hypothetical protein